MQIDALVTATPPASGCAAPPARAASDDDCAGCANRFGDNEVLRGIDLDIPAGQFVAIVGRSGCGKSTLLRLIAGLDRPTTASIALRRSS